MNILYKYVLYLFQYIIFSLFTLKYKVHVHIVVLVKAGNGIPKYGLY